MLTKFPPYFLCIFFFDIYTTSRYCSNDHVNSSTKLGFPGEESLVYLSLYSQHIELNKCLLNFEAWDNGKKKKTPHHIKNTQLSGLWTFPCGSDGKESACNEGDLCLICGLGRSPGGGHDNHSSSLAWRIPWTEELGGLQSMGSQRVGHDWATKETKNQSTHPLVQVLTSVTLFYLSIIFLSISLLVSYVTLTE